MIGVHASVPGGYRPPQPILSETIAWFDPVIPPADDRTVMVRIAGEPATWPAWYCVEQGLWICATNGGAFLGVVEAWAERPTGLPPAHQARPPAAAEVIAKLTIHSGNLGHGVRLTSAGQCLPPGLYELQLVSVSTSTTKAPS